MKFAVVVHHDPGSAYGVTVPDLPGCFSAGDTFDEALDHCVEAIELHLEGLLGEGMEIPRARAIEQHLDNPEFTGGTWGFIDFDIVPYLGNTEKINVTLPSSLIRKIDAKAGKRGRSNFLAEAALKELDPVDVKQRKRVKQAPSVSGTQAHTTRRHNSKPARDNGTGKLVDTTTGKKLAGRKLRLGKK